MPIQLPALTGHRDGLWWAGLDPLDRVPRPPLGGDADADVAIVGAGYTGLWTAYYLKRLDPSLRIVVLERSEAGAGASGRNGGWASAILPIGWRTVARRYGRDAALAWQASLDATLGEIDTVCAAEGIDAHLARDGFLEVATDGAQLAALEAELAEARHWGRGEDDLRRLSAAEARGMIDAPAALAGLFTPHCAVVQPARLVRGLARAVERLGVTVHEGTEVSLAEAGRVVTAAGTVRAPIVLTAVEGYAAGLAGQEGRRLPVRSTMIATEPLSPATWEAIGWQQRCTFKDFRRQLFYAQRTADGRIAFGGRGAPYRYGSVIDDPVRDLPGLARLLRDTLVSVLPQVGDAEISHVWGGVLGVPRDWMPSVAFDPATGLGGAGGYSGDGVALSNLAGRTLADLVLGRESDLVRHPWVGHRSRSWEPEPLRWLGTAVGERLARAADSRERGTGRPSRILGGAFAALTGR